LGVKVLVVDQPTTIGALPLAVALDEASRWRIPACMTDGRPGAGRWPRTVTMGGIPVAAVFG